MKTQPGNDPIATHHLDDEALAGDREARFEEARYRQSTPAEQQLATSLAGFLEAHGSDDALLRWLATLITGRIGDDLAELASRAIDAELPDARRHPGFGPDRLTDPHAGSRSPATEPK